MGLEALGLDKLEQNLHLESQNCLTFLLYGVIMNINNWTRRHFLKNTTLIALAIPSIFSLLKASQSWAKDSAADLPAGQTPLSETDPIAAALGFHQDAKKTDFIKYPDRKKPEAKNNFCKSCIQYNPVNASWGKCNVFANGLVSSKGWCSSYSPKTA